MAVADDARKQLAEVCAKENAMRLTGSAWDELKPSVRLTLLQDADTKIAALLANPEVVLRALGGEPDGEQGFNDWNYWRFPRGGAQ